MLDAMKMGRWLGISEQLTRAKVEVGAIVHRWDVPQGQRKPGQKPEDKEVYIEAKPGVWAVLAHDLRDILGRYYRTSPDPVTGQQGRVAGRMLQEDMVLGSWSPAIPLLFGLMSLLGVLACVLSQTWVLVPLLLAIVPAFILITAATEKMYWGVLATVLSVVLPMGGLSALSDHASSAVGGKFIAMAVMGILFFSAVLYASLPKTRPFFGAILGLGSVALFTPHVPMFFQPLVLALPGAILPMIWTYSESMRRAMRLAKQGQSSFESSDMPLAHVSGRLEQAKRASLDPSPLITIGRATGRFSMKGDGWSPDAGLPVRQSVNDLGTHMLVLGSTGRGKTSSIIRPYVVAWVRAGGNGCLVMDGKGGLPTEFAGMRDYLLISPSTKIVAMYQGLDAQAVARTWAELNITNAVQGEARMWADLSFNLCRHSAVVLEALVQQLDHEEMEDRAAGRPVLPRADRPWRWTLHNHHRLAVMGITGADAIAEVAVKAAAVADPAFQGAPVAAVVVDGAENTAAAASDKAPAAPDNKQVPVPTLKDYLDVLLVAHPSGRTGLLAEARHYFLSELPNMPVNMRGSVGSQFLSWLTPVTGHKELLAWAQAEEGECVEDCLHGKSVGISLPETRYGRSGVIATSFLKNRVFNHIRQRAEGNWRKLDPTAKPVLMVMDECQLLLSDADQEISPIGRSLGCYFLCCSQTIESIRQTSQNLQKTEAFLDSFQSWILLASSHETVDWASNRLGTTWRYSSAGQTPGVNFVDGAIKCLESPLFEVNHPSRRLMQTLLRRGAGGFQDAGTMPTSLTLHDDLAFQLSVSIPVWEEKPLLSRSDFFNLTAVQGVALVSLMRAGSPRRDFITLDAHMEELPKDLMAPDYAEQRALQDAEDEAEAIRLGKETIAAAMDGVEEEAFVL